MDDDWVPPWLRKPPNDPTPKKLTPGSPSGAGALDICGLLAPAPSLHATSSVMPWVPCIWSPSPWCSCDPILSPTRNQPGTSGATYILRSLFVILLSRPQCHHFQSPMLAIQLPLVSAKMCSQKIDHMHITYPLLAQKTSTMSSNKSSTNDFPIKPSIWGPFPAS